MYMRLIEVTGRNFDRADLDDVTDSLKAQFWRNVATVYCSNDDKFKGFIEYDADSDGIDPGTIVPHSPAKLEEMWMELTSFFSISEANFRLSGTHDHEFKRFVQGKLDVLYLGIAAAREAEITLAREQDQEATARVRAEYYKMLDDIRKRISAIESEMSSAASPIKLRLQVDLDFFLEERQMIMDALREQNL
ncbi:hypothetical protein L916_07339 [Phytophthora nicotianae]|uniref:Uncharacterized protein n=1 Tax=Phytophthora nicotianae TaxID=4792 RepID=W2J7N6_PHYNI|nr:hypothetical protein L916_07339 [Phytophthora nicotianae]